MNENVIHETIISRTIRYSQSSNRILVAIMLFGLFASGFDQGHLFSLVEGKEAFDSKWLHEFVHDMRHASGFPCH